MDMLTFAVSCLTGVGALSLIAIAGIGGFICFVMWQDKHEQPTQAMPMAWDTYTDPLSVDWEAVLDEAIERAQRDAW